MNSATHLTSSRKEFILLGVALLPLALRFVAPWFFPSWWGLNHLLFASATHSYITGLAVVFTLTVLWSERFSGAIVDALSLALWEKPKIAGSAVALIAGILFWIGSTQTQVFGDGYSRIGNLAQRTIPFVHPLEWGATQIQILAYGLFKGAHNKAIYDAAAALRCVAVISGVVTGLSLYATARRLSADPLGRSVGFAIMLSTGSLFLFFGNAEIYAPFAGLMALYTLALTGVWTASSATIRSRWMIVVIAIGAVAPFVVAPGIFLLPVTIFTVILALRSGHKASQSKSIKLGLALAGALLVVLVGALYTIVSNNLWVAARVVAVMGRTSGFVEGLFSSSYFFERINMWLVIFPLAPLAALVVFISPRGMFRDPLTLTLGVAGAIALIWMSLASPMVGIASGWVGLAPFVIPIAALSARIIVGQIEQFGQRRLLRLSAAVGLLSMALIAPVYLQSDTSVSYLERAYENHPERNLGLLFAFRDHYFFHGEYATVDKWEWSFVARSPQYLEYNSLRALLANNSPAEAVSRAPLALESYPYSADLYLVQSEALQLTGQYPAALTSIDKASELAPENVDGWLRRAEVWRQMQNEDSCLVSLTQALALDPLSRDAARYCGLYYLRVGNPDAAIREGLFLFELDSTSLYPFLIVGAAEYGKKNYGQAVRYLRRSLSLGGSSMPENETAERMFLDARRRLNVKDSL